MTSTNRSHYPWPSDAPLTRLIVERSSFEHPKCNNKHFIQSHHFNQQIDLILPTHDSHIETNDEDFFYSIRAQVTSLLEPEFLNTYVRGENCRFYALLQNAPIDQTSTIAFLPGKLVMSLTGELYTQLGLQGSIESYGSVKSKKTIFRNKYRVDIDISKADFLPGNALYDRVIWCFQDRIPAVELFVCCYKNGACKEIQFPSSVLHSSCFELRKTCEKIEGVPVPILDNNSKEPIFQSNGSVNSLSAHDEMEAIMNEFFIWNGLATSNLLHAVSPPEDSIQGVISQFRTGLNVSRGDVTVQKIEGFIGPQVVQRYVDIAKKLVNEGRVPWISIQVHGFQDSPVSFGECSHSSLLYHGDNDYTLVFLPRHAYWQFVSLGAKDKYS